MPNKAFLQSSAMPFADAAFRVACPPLHFQVSGEKTQRHWNFPIGHSSCKKEKNLKKYSNLKQITLEISIIKVIHYAENPPKLRATGCQTPTRTLTLSCRVCLSVQDQAEESERKEIKFSSCAVRFSLHSPIFSTFFFSALFLAKTPKLLSRHKRGCDS